MPDPSKEYAPSCSTGDCANVAAAAVHLGDCDCGGIDCLGHPYCKECVRSLCVNSDYNAIGRWYTAAGDPDPWKVRGERGQVQYEWHQDGWDIEVEFRADGTIESVYVGRA